ncbi:hypothetical protein MTP99_015228 [Tenebrio molitor]|jgi:uncharacterized membrane protein YfhO|nr:hypothetical protein MTP99_015228 [Tenebrio molitor]
MAKNPLCCLVWFVAFYFSFIIACFCCFWYILIYPCTVCIDALSGYTDLLLKGIQLPHYCAQKMVNCEGC